LPQILTLDPRGLPSGPVWRTVVSNLWSRQLAASVSVALVADSAPGAAASSNSHAIIGKISPSLRQC
jgi:hypothetical protein